MDNAADIGFSLRLSFVTQYKGMTMNGSLTKTLDFKAGTNEQFVILTHSNSSTALGMESDTGIIIN